MYIYIYIYIHILTYKCANIFKCMTNVGIHYADDPMYRSQRVPVSWSRSAGGCRWSWLLSLSWGFRTGGPRALT